MRKAIRLLAVSLTLSQGLAHAAAVNKVFYPIVEPGEWEIELRGFVVQDDAEALDGLQVNKADLAYGVTPRWFTELEWVFEREPGQSHELEAIASENVFQLTEQGEYFADFGLFAEYERELEADVNEVVLGPIVQKQWGSWLGTANLFFERQFGSDAVEHELEAISAAQIKYRLTENFEPGVEYYGDENSQNAGPAAFGLLRMSNGKLKWQAAWLFGLSGASPDNTLRWMLEYEF